MKKVEIENNYKYVYHYNNHGYLQQVKFYERKLFGLVNKFAGSYDFFYQDNKLNSQKNMIEGIGLTEAVNYFHEEEKLVKKEYYNNRMALRYYIEFEYEENQPISMKIFKYTGQELAHSKDTKLIKDYINETGRVVDYLNDMLDMVNELKTIS